MKTLFILATILIISLSGCKKHKYISPNSETIYNLNYSKHMIIYKAEMTWEF